MTKVSITPETEAALLQLQLSIGRDIQLALEKQTTQISETIREERNNTRSLVDGVGLRVQKIETKVEKLEDENDKIALKIAGFSGAIGVVVFIATQLLKGVNLF